jgi:UDP-N-acetylmuramate-alanine ligase
MSDFKNSFKGVKRLVIYKTYPARETKIDGGDAVDLFKNVKISKDCKWYVDNKYQLKKVVASLCKNMDCVLVLGAGNIYNIAKNVFKS